ncbi:MAG TPA: site-2 protease family protein, partial [Candidatus Paceibacterota bacterium]
MNIIVFLVILVVLILVHEFGHFLVAKWAKIRVDEFGIGFPPRLFGRKFNGTLYSVNALPLGGFVKIFGEDPDESSTNGPDRNKSFVHKPKLVQAAVLVAGIAGNIALAWFLLSVGFIAGMPTAVEDASGRTLTEVHLAATSILPNSPAEIGGLKLGDTLLKLQTESAAVTLVKAGDVSTFVIAHPDEALRVTVLRQGVEQVLTLHSKKGVISSEPAVPAIGVAIGEIGTLQLSVPQALLEGAKTTVHLTEATVTGIYSFLQKIFIGQGNFSEVTGPIGIVGMVGDASTFGFIYLLSFAALTSINLAVINLLP